MVAEKVARARGVGGSSLRNGRAGVGSIFGECFAPFFAIDDAERTGTIHAVPLAQPTTES